MNNTKQPKTGLGLPIFIMISPLVALVLTVFIWAVVNFVFGGLAYESSDSVISNAPGSTSIAEGAVDADQPDSSAPASLFDQEEGGSATARRIANIVTFLIGAYSIFGFVPCIVIGILMLNKRLDLRRKLLQANPSTENR